MKKVQKYFWLGLSFMYSLALTPLVVSAVEPKEGNYGLDETTNAVPGIKGAELDVKVLAGQYIGRALSFLGVIFFVLVLWGGFQWMTAQGDGKKVQEGKDIIIRASIGLIIIFSAYAITFFIGSLAENPAS